MLRRLIRKIWLKDVPKRKNVHIISFPKSGRTWTSFMIGTYLIKRYGLNPEQHNIIHELKSISGQVRDIPILSIHHDGVVHEQRPGEIAKDKSKYSGAKVLFIVRDPRDVVISLFFERSKRVPARNTDEEPFTGTIDEYLLQDRGSIDTIIEYMNVWYANRSVPESFKVIKYEDLMNDTAHSLKEILEYLEIGELDEEILAQTVFEGRFENMRKLETSEKMKGFGLKPGNKNDLESYKTRKGKIGGYIDYLDEEQVAYLNRRVKEKLNPVFGY